MSIRQITNAMIATAAAYAAVFVLLLVLNLISYNSADPEQFLDIFACAAFFLGAAGCGFISAKTSRSGGISAGVTAGIIYIGIIFLFSLLFDGERNFLWRLIINLFAVALAGAGGFFGGYKRPKKISPSKTRDAIRKKYLGKNA